MFEPDVLKALQRFNEGLNVDESKMNRLATKFRFLITCKPLFSTVRFSSQLHVSRLSFYIKNEDFHNMFSPFGDVKEAKLIMDHSTGRTKGFGYVTFKTQAEAEKAVKAMNGRIVQGRLIFVEFAKKRTDGEDDGS